eukprot:g14438.t1
MRKIFRQASQEGERIARANLSYLHPENPFLEAPENTFEAHLGTISVLEGYARAGEVLQGFYALMALWKSVEDLSGDQQLEVRTYGVSLKTLEESEPTADVAFTNWAAGRLFKLQGKYAEAEKFYERC